MGRGVDDREGARAAHRHAARAQGAAHALAQRAQRAVAGQRLRAVLHIRLRLDHGGQDVQVVVVVVAVRVPVVPLRRGVKGGGLGPGRILQAFAAWGVSSSGGAANGRQLAPDDPRLDVGFDGLKDWLRPHLPGCHHVDHLRWRFGGGVGTSGALA